MSRNGTSQLLHSFPFSHPGSPGLPHVHPGQWVRPCIGPSMPGRPPQTLVKGVPGRGKPGVPPKHKTTTRGTDKTTGHTPAGLCVFPYTSNEGSACVPSNPSVRFKKRTAKDCKMLFSNLKVTLLFSLFFFLKIKTFPADPVTSFPEPFLAGPQFTVSSLIQRARLHSKALLPCGTLCCGMPGAVPTASFDHCQL